MAEREGVRRPVDGSGQGDAGARAVAQSYEMSVKEGQRRLEEERQEGGRTGEDVSRTKAKVRQSQLPRLVTAQDKAHSDSSKDRTHSQEGDRPSSGCSFTSSEWGEVTPTDAGPGLGDSTQAKDKDQAQPSMKEEAGSALGHSSGYMSTSKRSLDVTDASLNHSSSQPHSQPHSQPTSQTSVSASPSRAPPSRLPVRQNSRQNSQESFRALVSPHESSQHSSGRSQTHPQPQTTTTTSTTTATTSTTQGHLRRQSSGRSETLSISSGRTASPATKMRLLDLASNRALERDGEDSVKSWSGGSDDTMSLGMSCSGLPVSADVPVFQKVQRRQQKGSQQQPVPTINQRPPSAEGEASDTVSGHTSPAHRPGSSSSTPKRSSHLSIPSVSATSTGSADERSWDDDDNIDELFAKHRANSSLGVSRSSIGDSRESLASVYSDAGEINYGRIPVSGEITFGLDFDHKLSALRFILKGCNDLAAVDTKHNRSDPYVKVYLLPDKTRSGKRKSKIKKHTLNPVYNETLTYSISQGELENRTLWVTVWHNDRLGRNDFLGEVTIPMDTYRFGDSTPQTYTLEARMPDTMAEETMQYKGDLEVSLMYVTPDKATDNKKAKAKSKKSKGSPEGQGEIHALIKSAKNLTAVHSNGTSNPFVKGYLLPDRGRTNKQKTPVVKNSVNPMWNHILVFDGVDAMEIADRSLELTVWDHEKLGTNEFLGGARLNLGLGTVKGGQPVEWMDGRGEEAVAWQKMMERPNSWIDARLPLRPSMGKAGAKK